MTPTDVVVLFPSKAIINTSKLCFAVISPYGQGDILGLSRSSPEKKKRLHVQPLYIIIIYIVLYMYQHG